MSLNVIFAMGALIRRGPGWNGDAYINNNKKRDSRGAVIAKRLPLIEKKALN